MLWIGPQNPARIWAAEQLTRGRVFTHAVSISMVEGVSGGAAMAALGVLADWAALNVAGFQPSISRELNIVDAGIGALIGDTLSGSAFIVLAIAFAIEVFDRFRVNAMLSTAVVAIAAALVAGADQEAILPGLTLVAGAALEATIVVWLYRRRGFLAAWMAGLAAGLLTDAMALRSLDDPDLLTLSGFLITIVVMVAAAGAWGAGRRLFQKSPALQATPN